MTFFEPYSSFLSFLHTYSNSRLLIDCGCGDGQLVQQYLSLYPSGDVLGIDIFLLGNPHRSEEKLPIYELSCELFPFQSHMLPLFCRPCHSGFVYETIQQYSNVISEFLYVGLEKNIQLDLDDIPYHHLLSHIGHDDEVCVSIQL